MLSIFISFIVSCVSLFACRVQGEAAMRSDTTRPESVEDGRMSKSPSDMSLSEPIGDLSDKVSSTELSDVVMLPGESMQKVTPDVTYVCPFRGPLRGTLFFTTYRLVFAPRDNMASNFEVPLCTIHSIEKVGRAGSKGENSYCIDVNCKDLRSMRLAFKQETRSRKRAFEHLSILAYPLSSGRPMFCYEYRLSVPGEVLAYFDMKDELQRLCVPNDRWRLTTANHEYALCDSYPAVCAVPATTTDKQLAAIAGFRSRSRFPALSWLHQDNRASLVRCSQPLVGTLNKRNQEDELMLRVLMENTPGASKIVVVDARPKRNAVANMALGGGYESDEHYPQMEFMFADIGNIHVMRESLKKVRELCYTSADDSVWLSSLEGTHWLEHVKLVLAGAVRIVDLIDRCRLPVLVHCSDGWDRTSQLTALAMLCLDSFYRTIRGFQVLVEKEWLAFGHKFQQRCGHGDRRYTDEQRSPIFIQFLDAVWQIMQQFPSAFEFNNAFLLTIADHLYSCLFGTFLFNTEKQRVKDRERTLSLWYHVNQHVDDYLNPLYTATSSVLYPVAAIRRMQLWTAYYARFNPRLQPQEDIHICAMELGRSCRQLEMQVEILRTELARANMPTTPGSDRSPKGQRERADANLRTNSA